MKQRKKIWACLFCLWLSATTAFALNSAISMNVDRDHVTVGEPFKLTIEIQGGGQLSNPQIDNLDKFEITSKSSQSAVEFNNGQMKVVTIFAYTLIPQEVGQFNLGPVMVHIEGQVYPAGPIAIHVAAAAARQPSYMTNPNLAGPSPGLPDPDFPPDFEDSSPGSVAPSEAVAHRGRDTFITATTNKKSAYVGEEILYSFRFYSAVSVRNAALDLPDFKEFIMEELGKERQYTTMIEGREYLVQEYKLALFPTRSGDKTLAPAKVKGQIVRAVPGNLFNDPFFQGFGAQGRIEEKSFVSNPVQIKVLDLPPAPENFTGLVGQFKLSSQWSKPELDLGETAQWKLEFSGSGNIQAARLPQEPKVDGFKIYADKPSLQIDKNPNGLRGTKTFSFAMVANRPGLLTVPALSLSYFDPSEKTYLNLATDLIEVKVKGSANHEQLVTAGLTGPSTEPQTANPHPFDLYPLRAAKDLLYSNHLSIWLSYLAWFSLIFMPALWIFILLLKKFQASSLAQTKDRKRSKAFKKAKAALNKIKKQDPQAMANILKEYFSDRFTVRGHALTPIEIEQLLRERGIPLELIRSMVYLSEQLDAWQYSGMKQAGSMQQQLKAEIIALLREMEKVL